MERIIFKSFFNVSAQACRIAMALLIFMGMACGQSADGSGTRKIKPPAKPAIETQIVPGDTMPRGKGCKRTRVPKPIRVKEDKPKKDTQATDAANQ